MYYSYLFSVPAATPELAPYRQTLKLTKGIIHRVELSFPPGCVALVKCRFRRGLHQVWPTNRDEVFAWDAVQIAWNDFEPLEEAPYELLFEAWSPAAIYEHSIAVRLGILPREIVQPVSDTGGILKKIGQLIFGGA